MKLKEYFEKLESTAFGPWLAAFKKLFSKEELNGELSEVQDKKKNEEKFFDNVKQALDKIQVNMEIIRLIEPENSTISDNTETFITNFKSENFSMLSRIKHQKLLLEQKIKEEISTNYKVVILSNNVVKTNKLGLEKLEKGQKFDLQTKCEFKDNKIYKLNDQHFIKIKDELFKINELPKEFEKTTHIILEYKEQIVPGLRVITNLQLEKFAEFILNLPENRLEYYNYFLVEEEKDGYSKIDAFKNVANKNKLVEKFQNSDKYNYEEIKQNVRTLQAYLGSYEDNCGIPKSDLLGQGDYNNHGYDNA